MRTVIRHAAFETNSSSTHSITIAKGEHANKAGVFSFLNSDGVLSLPTGEFGWEEESYHDLHTKLAYLATAVMSGVEKGGAYKDRATYKLLAEVLREACPPATDVIIEPCGDKWHPYGYIDHQSSDVPDDAFESRKALEDFLFNPNSYLVTDNDNH